MIKYLVLPIFAYLLGSIPWGLILTRLFTPINIRQVGSGNIGATNVGRMAGPGLGVLTLAGDILKGAVPVWLAVSMTTPDETWGALYIAIVAFAAFTGHLYPVYLKFKNGGKGVATAAGCFGVISPVALVILILVFIMFVCCSNRVSLASLAAAAVLPVAVWKATGSEVMSGCAVITTIFIYFRHVDNIKRILAGTEPTIWK
ncbi:MAG: glycerol-3-phosphate 1-O-acyltransferase PlsY [Deltaproteobacteria bacterium]|nr:glycerol-3-phosphate 1-O-acyltransferase PlsY [Deltaproteobacteria bacterium]